MRQKYYSLIKNSKKKEATLTIYGEITSYPYNESDVSSYNLSKQLLELDVNKINVRINSIGGEVGEGLAIYNALKSNKAKVKTFCDGFACSIASVIFMAGDERAISKSSLLMIHNAWTFASGNSNALRKQADDLDKITSASINAYMEHVTISEKELKTLMDNETWLDYQEAYDKGFATEIVEDKDSKSISQNVKQSLIKMILHHQEETKDDDEKGGGNLKFECQNCGYIHEGELPEYFVCPECGADKDNFIELEDEEVSNESDEKDIDLDDETQTKNDEQPNSDDSEENKDESDDKKETDDSPNKEDDESENKDKTVTKEQIVTFFNSIIGGMK